MQTFMCIVAEGFGFGAFAWPVFRRVKCSLLLHCLRDQPALVAAPSTDTVSAIEANPADSIMLLRSLVHRTSHWPHGAGQPAHRARCNGRESIADSPPRKIHLRRTQVFRQTLWALMPTHQDEQEVDAFALRGCHEGTPDRRGKAPRERARALGQPSSGEGQQGQMGDSCCSFVRSGYSLTLPSSSTISA